MKYSVDWVKSAFEKKERLDFLFFWGHSTRGKESTGKFVLSQWYQSPFRVNDVLYRTAEHWMMAHKADLFADNQAHEAILAAETPEETKMIGRAIRNFDTQLWDEHKYYIVLRGNIHRFNQNPTLKDYLLATENKIIVEASPVDKIWGIGLAQDAELIEDPGTWKGENLLGFALMEARDFLIDAYSVTMSSMMLPPWKKYPGISPFDIFWRMGTGEDYLIQFHCYYNALSISEKRAYELANPANGHWVTFYMD